MPGATSAALTTSSQLSCAHGGTVSLHSSQHALTADGHPVLLQSDLAGSTISNCSTPVTSTTTKCLTVVSVLAGMSTALTVNGTPVLTAQAQGLTDGVAGGPGTWSVRQAGQTKLVTR